jgi:ankyrin repeat protein
MELQLAHSSVQQYLRSHRIAPAFPRKSAAVGRVFQTYLSEIIARTDIVKVCLAYLSQLDEKSSAEEIKADYPFAEYSAECWVSHAKFVETKDDVQERILSFFLGKGQRYASWAKISSIDRGSIGRNKTLTAPPLYYASLAGLQCIVARLLETGVNVNAEGGCQGSALQAASLEGHEGIVRLLLENGANADPRDDLGGNALQVASAKGHEGVVQLLLQHGAAVDNEGGIYGSPLQGACLDGNIETVIALLEKGANINAPAGLFGNALQIACGYGSKELVQLLLQNGADVNAPAGLFGDALQLASNRGELEIVQLLLQRGADVNAPPGNHGDALQLASATGHTEVVRLLLEEGADVNRPGHEPTKGYLTRSYEAETGLIQSLYKKKRVRIVQDYHYKSALQGATAGGHQEIIRILLEKGATV